MVNHDGWTCPTCRRSYAPWMPSCSCINSAVGVNTASMTITPHADDTAYWRLSVHVENALAPVLGYEYDEAVGWNVGEHTAESLVMAAASRIAELIAALEAWLAWAAKHQADLYFGDLPESSFTQVGDLVVASRAVLARVRSEP